MENKSKQWILFGLVIMIWGFVIYRFFHFSEDESELVSPILLKKTDNNTEKKEAYIFQLNYRDPFFANSIRRTAKSYSDSPHVYKPKGYQLPQLEYRGMVKGSSTKSALMVIDGVSLMLSERDTCKHLTLRRIEPDQVIFYAPLLDSQIVCRLPQY